MILLIILSAFFLQSNAQNEFRYDANGLRILISDEWFYILNTPTFSYVEANFICTEFLNSTFLRYEIVPSTGVTSLTEIDCTTRNCSFTYHLEDLSDQQLVNITCMDALPQQQTITRLRDGSLATLILENEEYIWGQFCYLNTNGWDLHAATLACRKAGYTSVFPGKEKLLIVKPVVFGIEYVNCENATSFKECEYTIAADEGRCEHDKVIQVECIDDETTIQTGTIPTVSILSSTTSTRSFPSKTSTVFPSTTSYTTSMYVTTVAPTNSPFLNINWMFILVGFLLFIIFLSIGITIILVIVCCYCIKKEKPTNLFNLDHLYGNPNPPATLRTRSEQAPPPQQYYVLP